MPKPKEDPTLLWDMLESARQILEFINGQSFHQFVNDSL